MAGEDCKILTKRKKATMKCDSIHNYFEDDEESEVEKVEAGGEVPVHIWSCSVVANSESTRFNILLYEYFLVGLKMQRSRIHLLINKQHT